MQSHNAFGARLRIKGSRLVIVHLVLSFVWFFCFVQFLEAFQAGPVGLNVVSHVVGEPNCVIDHAPIQDQETMEQNALDQLMKQGHVPLKCAQHQVTVKAPNQIVLTVLYKLYC